MLVADEDSLTFGTLERGALRFLIVFSSPPEPQMPSHSGRYVSLLLGWPVPSLDNPAPCSQGFQAGIAVAFTTKANL